MSRTDDSVPSGAGEGSAPPEGGWPRGSLGRCPVYRGRPLTHMTLPGPEDHAMTFPGPGPVYATDNEVTASELRAGAAKPPQRAS